MLDGRQVPRADRRQVLRAMLLAGAGLVLPGACGVPSGGPPIIDGQGPPRDAGASGAGNRMPPGPEGATDAEDLVRRFLDVASGKLDTDGRAQALIRARSFLTTKAQGLWQPGSSTTVVRFEQLTAAVSPEGTSLTTTVLPVGLISDRGTVEPPSVPNPVTASFVVVANTDSHRQAGLLIDDLPDNLMLAESALTRWYSSQLIYFWDDEEDGLVPDVRYLPTSLTIPLRGTEIVNWLIEGPSNWLQQAVIPIPTGTALVGPFLTQDGVGRLTVNLSGVPPKTDLKDMMAQLRWSLRQPQYADTLNLQISSQPARVDGDSDDFLARNLAESPNRAADPDKYCVANGYVRALRDPSVILPVLASADNSHVRFAAISRGDAPMAAVVRDDHYLWLGRPGHNSKPEAYQRVAGAPKIAQRPMWLDTPTPSVLAVGEDGGLYLISLARAAGVVTPVPIGGISRLTAFSVAPDGRRIALVADGAGWVAPLVRSRNTVSVGGVRKLNIEVAEPQSIAWTRLDRVVVAGGTNQYQLTEVSIDGTNPSPFGGGFTTRITQVVAYPYLPSHTPESGPVMVQTQTTDPGGAYLLGGVGWQALDYQIPARTNAPRDKPASPFFVD